MDGDSAAEALKEGQRALGHHPGTGEEITVRRGPYGLYVQQGEPDPADKKAKARRTSIPRNMDGNEITLEPAIGLLSLPRLVGIHPERAEPIEAGLGRFGPFVRMGAIYGSLDRDEDVLAVGLNRAVDVLARKLDSVRPLGPHPADKEQVLIRKGRFGPYVQHGQTVANLPRDALMDDYTLAEAVVLLRERGKALKAKPGAARRGTKAAKAANGRSATPKAAATKKARKAVKAD